MGREDIAICVALHEALSHADTPVSPAVGAAAEAILAADEYDRRLRAFAEHQRTVSRRAGELTSEIADPAAQQIVHRLADLHAWHVLWADRRADVFAATRLWENGRRPRDGQGTARGVDTASALATDQGLLARPGDQEDGADGHGA
jgi:hypothetical protein